MKYKTYEEAYEKAVKPQMFEMQKDPRNYYNKEFITKKLEEIEKKLDDVTARYEALIDFDGTSLRGEKGILNARLSMLHLERKKIHLQGQRKMLENDKLLDDVRDKLDEIRAKIRLESRT